MNIPSPRPKNRPPRAKPTPRAKKTVTAGKLADELLRYFAEHPQTGCVAVTVHGKNFVVQPQKVAPARRRKSLPIAPSGYFAPYYTQELATEDNRHAAHSTHDPADFTE